MNPLDRFDVRDQVVLVTGGSGVLGSVMACELAAAGMRVAILGGRIEMCQEVVNASTSTATASAVAVDVLDRAGLEAAQDHITATLGPEDLLINAAGGNSPHATTGPQQSFFDLAPAGIEAVLHGNFSGTVQPCQVWGRTMAQTYSSTIRVNAIAPGFFLTEQNHSLLTDATSGDHTARGEAIIARTPQKRFGSPDDLLGALLWLASPAAAFVTGIVVPVGGGFAAVSGV